MKCRRAPGRPRPPGAAEEGLIASVALLVCDRCWYAAGGADAVQAALDEDGRLVLTLEGSPAFEALVAAIDEYDQRHPIDRFLIESGIRWATLRHIAVPARCDLVRWALQRIPTLDTRMAISPDTWMDAVTTRMQQQTGTEFRYNPKRRRWWRIANVLRCCSDHRGRPLAWVSQEEIAAAVGCSTRTVRRCLAWLQREGLLHEVLPGCQLPRQAVPDDETAAEQAERLARTAAAVAAEDAARARARAELNAVHEGLFGDQAAAAADVLLSPADEALLADALAEVAELEPGLVQLVPVYELRVPLSDAERAEEAAHTVLGTAGEDLARRYAADLVAAVNAHIYGELFVIGHDGHLTPMTGTDAAMALTSGNAVGLLRPDQNGHPPQVVPSKDIRSIPAQPVDKGPASPGIDQEVASTSVDPEVTAGNGKGPELAADERIEPVQGNPPATRQSEAVRAAQWLIRSRLHPDLCVDVAVHWLAGVIRGSRLLSAWDVTYGADSPADPTWNRAVPAAWNELADLIEGTPQYSNLPRYIRNPRGWIKARFARADRHMPPSKAKIIQQIENTSSTLQQRRQDDRALARRAEIAALRHAIDCCPLCDELGWLALDPTDPTAPVVRCSHDPDTGGEW